MTKDKYFDKEKQEDALKWLKGKWPQEKQICEICDSKSWSLANDLIMPLPFVGGAVMVGGVSYPLALVTCNNCGNSKFFNAVIMGVVKSTGENNG